MTLFQALFVYFLSPVISFLILVIFIRIIMSWLFSFNIINFQNQLVATIWQVSGAITEPLVRPIRNRVPPLGGMDFSPFILLLVLYFLQGWLLPGLVFGGLRLF